MGSHKIEISGPLSMEDDHWYDPGCLLRGLPYRIERLQDRLPGPKGEHRLPRHHFGRVTVKDSNGDTESLS